MYSLLPGNGISHIGTGLSVRLTIKGLEFQRPNALPINTMHTINSTKIQIDQTNLDMGPVCRLKRNRNP